MNRASSAQRGASPFDLADSAAYADWRGRKLEQLQCDAGALIVDIENPMRLQADERQRLLSLIDRHNMAVYRLADAQNRDKEIVHALGRAVGLNRLDTNLRADEDSVTSLEVRSQQGNQYIPYTNRRLSWHTDGYYNTLDSQVRGIIMHCAQPAAEGGENALIDHELMYIRLRDENPAYIEALMRPEAMTIPPNVENGVEIRPAQPGPVFSVDPQSGRLHMRYSARTRNIEWAGDADTRNAAAAITDFLQDDSITCRLRLNAGEGIICNNVLHNRTGFTDTDAQKRLMYRARYYDRVAQYDDNQH